MQGILTVFGNRPQFIKSSVVSKRLIEFGCREVVVNTGQHFDANMSDSFFTELSLKEPKYKLNINKLSDLQFISSAIVALESVLLKEKPNTLRILIN